jgi:serine/threonine protein kinase
MASLGTRGPWTKLQAIGKGSFGTVYLVQRTGAGNQQKYVMKEVNLRGLPKAEMLAAQNEVAALQKVKHPHAVAIADALVVDDTLCIIMEWAQGKDLGALIAQRKTERRPFTEDEVLKIFWQLTSVLAHCHHELHLLHRDLKPQNVFLSANGDVKLGDFGLAKALEATCAIAKTQCGTPIYMSPELCLGQDYNRAADVWALGCILYELMTLTMPWADCRVQGPGGMSALLKKIASSSLDLTQCKKQYSAELCGLLSALLHKKGENRPALDQVLQLPFIARAATPRTAPRTAPLPPAGAEQSLPPSWQKVPSKSRPGQFSYVHVPTGYKQAFFPERDELPEEVIAMLKKQTFTPGKPPPPTALAPPPRASPMGVAASPRAAPTPPPPPPLFNMAAQSPQLPTPQGARPTPRAAPAPPGVERPLPPSWRKVPSASRPGAVSYLHVPTGYKQQEVPLTDTPDPKMLEAWKKAKAAATGNRPVATAALQPGASPQPYWSPKMGANKLEPVPESRALRPTGQANGPNQTPPGAAKNPFDFKSPQHQQHQHQQHQQQPVGQRPRF